MKIPYAAALLPAAVCLLSGCGPAAPSASGTPEIPTASREVFAMDTYMTVTCYGDEAEAACREAVEEIVRLDGLLSVGAADSEISRINRDRCGTLSPETAEMLECARKVYDTADGTFDVTIYPLMELWGFTSGEFAVPDAEELERRRADVGSEKMTWDPETRQLELGPEQGIDLGGVAKGYTSSRIMEIFADHGLVSGLVSLGGNVQAYGTKTDGSKWRVGIQDPHHPEEQAFLGILSIQDQAVITSGAYERNFTDEATGQVYHHILDPATGYPAEAGLISATIVTPDGTLADTLSTACYVMGAEKSLDYWRTYGEEWNFDLILMTDEDQIYVTEGIAEDLQSDYPVTVVRSGE